MEKVLLRAFTFICIVLLANVLKVRGLFNKKDSSILSKIIVNVTLPGALISSATKFTFNKTTITILLIAMIANVTMATLGKFIFSKYSKVENGSAMFSCTGYNVGNVTIPFATAFFDGTGMSYVCMYDVGNFTTWMGGIYPYIKNFVKGDGSKFNIKYLIKILLKSAPFITYLTLMVLAVLRISLPTQVLSIVSTIGSANSFLVFFMIGIMLEIKWDKYLLGKAAKILLVRFFGFMTLSLIVYFVIPLPQIAKTAVILCLAAPIPNLTTVFSAEIGDDSSLPALVNSLSIIVGLICSSAVLMILL